MRSWFGLLLVLITCSTSTGNDQPTGTLLVCLPDHVDVVRVTTVYYDVTQVRRTFVERIFLRYDHDQDTVLNPEEAARMPVWDPDKGQLQLLGNGWRAADRDPSDRKLSLHEVNAFMNRTMGPPVRIEVDQRGVNRASLLFTLIDRNRDGTLDQSEFSSSAPHLHRCDFDDDEMLTLSELAEVNSSVPPADVTSTATDPFLFLELGQDPSATIREIETRYRSGDLGIPTSAVHGLSPGADTNADQHLSAAELAAAFTNLDHAACLKIRPTGAGCGTRWIEVGDDPEVRSFRRSENVKLDGLQFRIIFRSAEQLEKLRLQELNTQFGDADRDNNDYLSRSEYAELLSVAETSVPADSKIVDQDNNEQITREELLAAGELRAAFSRCQLQLTVIRESMSLFQMLDLDRNQGISHWEIQTAPLRLETLDRNRDGRVSRGELSGEVSLELGFAGVRQDSSQTMVVRNRNRPVSRRATTTGPAWFQRMDRNQDQRISWREFLGSRTQFDELDTDHDESISAAEAKP